MSDAQPLELAGRVSAACARCGSGFLVPPEALEREPPCPWCGGGPVEAAPTAVRAQPELAVAHALSDEALRDRLGAFLHPVWFADLVLDPERLARRAVPVWWPSWLVDAEVSGVWNGSVGFDYEVKSAVESFAAGQWSSRDVIEVRVRWEPRTGEARRRFDNLSVAALEEADQVVDRLGGFEAALTPFVPSAPGWIRLPDRMPQAAWPEAEAALRRALADDCRRAAGGQHVRDFYVHAAHEGVTWTTALKPMYAVPFRDAKGRDQVLWVHGITGRAWGPRPASMARAWRWAAIFGLSAAACLLCAAGSGVVGIVVWILLPIALVAVLAGLILLVPAAWAVIHAYTWNAAQERLVADRDRTG